jgi:Papain family cysteine protease
MPWGNLNDEARQALSRRALGTVSDAELDQRIRRDDSGRVRFRLFGAEPRPDALRAYEEDRFDLGSPPPAEVTLIAPEDFDYEPQITAEDLEHARPITERVEGLREYFARDTPEANGERATRPGAPLTPPTVDHRPSQSPVKNQQSRGTCVSHASLGLLEAALHVPDDLSEQYAHYKFNEFENRPQDQDNGLRTTNAAPYLTRDDGRTCLESDWPYIPDQPTITAAVHAGTYGPPEAAEDNQTYGYLTYKLIDDAGLEGESIKNTRFLESLLALGYDIVIGTWVSWDDSQNAHILRPLLDSNGEPVGRGGHAMLVVGYDRPDEYFILKNSWGLGWGHAGYGYFHYDYIRSCFKYGFTVAEVVPAAVAAA